MSTSARCPGAQVDEMGLGGARHYAAKRHRMSLVARRGWKNLEGQRSNLLVLGVSNLDTAAANHYYRLDVDS